MFYFKSNYDHSPSLASFMRILSFVVLLCFVGSIIWFPGFSSRLKVGFLVIAGGGTNLRVLSAFVMVFGGWFVVFFPFDPGDKLDLLVSDLWLKCSWLVRFTSNDIQNSCNINSRWLLQVCWNLHWSQIKTGDEVIVIRGGCRSFEGSHNYSWLYSPAYQMRNFSFSFRFKRRGLCTVLFWKLVEDLQKIHSSNFLCEGLNHIYHVHLSLENFTSVIGLCGRGVFNWFLWLGSMWRITYTNPGNNATDSCIGSGRKGYKGETSEVIKEVGKKGTEILHKNRFGALASSNLLDNLEVLTKMVEVSKVNVGAKTISKGEAVKGVDGWGDKNLDNNVGIIDRNKKRDLFSPRFK